MALEEQLGSGNVCENARSTGDRLMQSACLKMIYELAKKDPRVVFIGTDNAPGLLSDMQADMPDRFFMEGTWEANLIGLASGLSADGFIPFILNHATFITRRGYEQILLDSCLQKRPVVLIGSGGGVATAHLGPTHTAIEDMAIMRTIPGMTVIAPCDADEVTRIMPLILDWPASVYLRLAKYGKPIVSRPEPTAEIGKAILMRNATTQGRGVLIVSTGAMTHRALAAAELLSKQEVDCTVLHFHTVKPLDQLTLIREARQARLLVTIEEHIFTGGLGSACLEVLADNMSARELPDIYRIALADEFVQNYGSQDALLEKFEMQPIGLAGRIARRIAQTAR
jgi:transketolase